jgi:lysophospholipase L1-like esterase
MKGTMDNIRIYDFAMTEDQMQEYAVNKSLSASGVQIAESENGKVTTNNYTPEVGEEVVFNVAPNAGYELVELKVNGETLEAVDGVYKTEMIYDGLYVEATFGLTTEGKLLKAVSMGHGAGVRYGGTADYSGLRFRIQSPKAEYEKLGVTAEYGILVIPADYQKTYGKFTVENLFGANAKYHLAERNEDGTMVEYTGNLPQIMNFWTNELYYNEETDCYEYYGSITNINAKNLVRQFVGVGVAKYGDDYIVLNYANNDIANNTRSVYQVSKLVVLDETADPIAKAWVERNYIKPVESAVSVLANKKLSVIGDSISTYEGVSNNATANSTIGGNAVFYKTQMTLNDTWWKQTANNTGMEILVNNSWSSSNVAVYGDNTLESKAGCGDRAVNLHDDTNNVNPDIIAAYIGINDCGCLTSVGDFDEISDIWDGEKYVGEFTSFSRAYARMVHQIVTKYDGANVFLFTLPRNGYLWTGTKDEYNALQDEYNKMIHKIAEIFGCQVVDLATAVGEDYSEYLLSDNIHPNAKGMDIITAAFETALYSYYTANEQ